MAWHKRRGSFDKLKNSVSYEILVLRIHTEKSAKQENSRLFMTVILKNGRTGVAYQTENRVCAQKPRLKMPFKNSISGYGRSRQEKKIGNFYLSSPLSEAAASPPRSWSGSSSVSKSLSSPLQENHRSGSCISSESGSYEGDGKIRITARPNSLKYYTWNKLQI
jgi:hypothetical protein